MFELLAFVGKGVGMIDVAATRLLDTDGEDPDPAVDAHAVAAIPKAQTKI